ncbi:MAG: ATP-dependent ligase [Frondihabitans sp.]|nr:ATP-dependent ligase [Frondihabitans sp.]
MGSLIYGSTSIEIVFEDRTLEHLQIVIATKLRRRESFFFSWRDPKRVGDGRSSLWMDASIPLYFKYKGGRVPSISRPWLAELTASANSSSGLVLTDEPSAENSTKP